MKHLVLKKYMTEEVFDSTNEYLTASSKRMDMSDMADQEATLREIEETSCIPEANFTPAKPPSINLAHIGAILQGTRTGANDSDFVTISEIPMNDGG